MLATLLLDWAIIALTSLVGASAIVKTISAGPATTGMSFVVLTVVGMLVQARLMRTRLPETQPAGNARAHHT